MKTDQLGRSLSSHTHDEFQLYKNADYWYVYKIDTTYYAKNLSTGAIDYSGANFVTVLSSVISAITNSGFIKLGTGMFLINGGAITTGDKPIIIEGSGWGRSAILTDNPGTLLKSDTTGAYYLLQFGAHGSTVEGAGIRNCMFLKDPANTECLGAVDLYNTINSFVDHCYFYGFERASDSPPIMSAISIRGATDETMGGWCNRAMFNHIRNPDIGIFLGANANHCFIEGNHIEGSGTWKANGIKCDGTGAPIASPYGCLILGNRIRNFDYVGPSRGLWITAGCANSGRHSVIGNIFNECDINFEVTSGIGIGECTFVGNVFGTAASSKGTDASNVKSYYYNNKNYVTENFGAQASVADGGTISHGLETTPTAVILNGTINSEVITPTAKNTTTFTVAIKKYTGSWVSGTTQTIYWRAWI